MKAHSIAAGKGEAVGGVERVQWHQLLRAVDAVFNDQPVLFHLNEPVYRRTITCVHSYKAVVSKIKTLGLRSVFHLEQVVVDGIGVPLIHMGSEMSLDGTVSVSNLR